MKQVERSAKPHETGKGTARPCALLWHCSTSFITVVVRVIIESPCPCCLCRRPGFLFNAFSNDAYVDGLVKCKEQVLVTHWALTLMNVNGSTVFIVELLIMLQQASTGQHAWGWTFPWSFGAVMLSAVVELPSAWFACVAALQPSCCSYLCAL